MGQRRATVPQKAFARRGQTHGARAVVDQGGAHGGFEVADLLAHGGLA